MTTPTTPEQLRQWDNDHVWHPFTPMQAYREEDAPIIERGEGFSLFDVNGTEYLDGISSLWCNVHGHQVPEIDAAIKEQLGKIGHSTLLGLSSTPSIELAKKLVELTPENLTKVFYTDSGATAVEAALKIAYQYHQQKKSGPEDRRLFGTVRGAYHGDTIGSVSVGSMELFHSIYGKLLFETVTVPSPAVLHRPDGTSAADSIQHCFDEAERIITEHGDQLAAFIVEPLVQGAAGILVHPQGYLKHLRELTSRHGIPLIADEVAVGFGRTGTLFACEQEEVQPDLMCVAKGLTGGYLPVAATLASDEIFEAFLAEPAAGKTFFHGHTFTGNPLGCAAALASIELFEQNSILEKTQQNAAIMAEKLKPLADHPNVGEVRQKGIMVGIELVARRDPVEAYPTTQRTGHLVTLAARKRGAILRPLGDVVVLMPAPAMPRELVERLCDIAVDAIVEVTESVRLN
ncbi:adenosylmethionine--8-amino-7-oxononanoate transaminase [Thalassoglobus polymorphus]|uniref:Adenosylmethionine-8-amino-7-oxononanoate aminotransferase n=1 Tax=Thalassoglobus polymorphus TaxID=2527994 RepID=A0A517QVI5_9PLAN|nr:adenosylmethionine--8-amino-7-oxononanoate transaminase [Thalassoglobus polymorphus]QDT35645.1 L-Lysine-8-amino-7-oxononanoate aminotransferase [Thalassoglobus polymorphus]